MAAGLRLAGSKAEAVFVGGDGSGSPDGSELRSGRAPAAAGCEMGFPPRPARLEGCRRGRVLLAYREGRCLPAGSGAPIEDDSAAQQLRRNSFGAAVAAQMLPRRFCGEAVAAQPELLRHSCCGVAVVALQLLCGCSSTAVAAQLLRWCGTAFAGQLLRCTCCRAAFASQLLRCCGTAFAGQLLRCDRCRAAVAAQLFAGQLFRRSCCGAAVAGQFLPLLCGCPNLLLCCISFGAGCCGALLPVAASARFCL
jgi:hypothetical protein